MPTRFPCTVGGAIAEGRRRLAWLLWALTLVMLAVAAWMAWERRVFPALLCLIVAGVAWTSWRMSGDLDPLWIEIDEESLSLQLRRKRLASPLLAPAARRLTADEIAYVTRLASRAAGIVAGTGGFDSQRLGEFNLYASDLARAVLVETGESRWVVTPDDPDALVAALGRSSG
ncbi:MAG: PH domain-containing protein [Thermoanaerobaculia bacterium]